MFANNVYKINLLQEGAEILGEEPIAESRAQTKALQDAVEEEKKEEESKDGEEDANPLKRTHTMAETLQVIVRHLSFLIHPG